MSRFILTIMLALAVQAAQAQSRPSTVQQSCAASQRMVQANGAIVLGTGGYTYDRFVRDYSFCQHGEYLEPAWVPSRDVSACFVGYRCKVDIPWD